MPAPALLPALANTSDLFVVSRTTKKREFANRLSLPGGLGVPVALLLMAVFLLSAAFVFWY